MQEVSAEEASFLNGGSEEKADPPSVAPKKTKKRKEKKLTGLCSVSSPKQVGEGVTAYVTYAVQTKDSNGIDVVAVRRFSDFEWLHQRLSDEFLDALIPPIPEKQIMNRLASSFVEHRRKELERFLQRVMSHQRLSKSQFLQTFLTATESEMGRQRDTKFPKKAIGEETPTNAFFGWASNAFSAAAVAAGKAEATKEVNSEFDDLKSYISGLHERLVTLEAHAASNIAKKKELDNTLVNFSLNAAALGDAEVRDQVLAGFWKKLSDSLKQMAVLNSQLATKESDKFHDVLKDYVRVTASAKQMLQNRFEVLGKLQVAQQKNASSVGTLLSLVEEMSTHSQEEINSFKTTKTKELFECLRALVRINMEHQERVNKLWKNLLSEIEEHNEA